MGTPVLSTCRPDATPSALIDAALGDATASVAVMSAQVECLDAAELAGFVPKLGRLLARCESVKLAALRRAETLAVADLVGARSTSEWIADATGTKTGTARRELDVAARLDDLDEIGDALADGSISLTQAGVLARATGASDDEQRELLDAAGSQSVNELESTVHDFRLRKEVPTGEVVPGLIVTARGANVSVEATLSNLGGETFTTAIDAAAAQLSHDEGAAWSQRRADGLIAVCRYFLEHAHLPATRLGRPHVLVDIPIDTLTTGSGAATLGSGAVIDAATARTMCCDAGISRLISGPGSEPLDIGRTRRSIPAGIARFLLVDDRHCRWPGCTSPAWGCEAHHVRFWEGTQRGPTNTDNLVLLCWHHHHLLHHSSRWQLTLHAGSRRLDLHDDNRLIASTDPPRRRPRPAIQPAPPNTEPLDRAEQLGFTDVFTRAAS